MHTARVAGAERDIGRCKWVGMLASGRIRRPIPGQVEPALEKREARARIFCESENGSGFKGGDVCSFCEGNDVGKVLIPGVFGGGFQREGFKARWHLDGLVREYT